jgi:GTPase SAR1 family protein
VAELTWHRTDTLRQTSEPAIGNHSALIDLLNRSHLSFQTRPNSIRSSLRDSFTSLDPSPPYALSLNGDITDAIKRIAEDVTLYLSDTDSVAGVCRSKSSLRAENVPQDTVASNEDGRLREYDEPSNLRTRESNPTPALAVATENFEEDDIYGPTLSGSYQTHIHDVESSTLVVDNSSNINATVANNVNTEAISTSNQLFTRPAEAAAPNSNPVPVLLYTIAIAGSEDSGKSELVNWFLHSGLDEESLLKVYSDRLCKIDDANVVVDLIDNIGQEHYASMRYNHLSRAEGILLLYKTSSRASFEEAQLIEQLVSQMEEERANRNIPKHPVLLVAYGIGSEAKQHVSREEGQALALKSGCTFIELRGRDYASFQEAVYDVTRLVRKQYSNYTPHYQHLPDRPHFGPTVMDTKESQTVSEREERSLTRNLFKEIRKRRRG